ncbi:VapE domain-containing protein [Pseudomonas fluorescens]|uniref:VapE domain-containing protein n=1 Tax=Pseudomonas fluorescens TaxID=294 RepID=UPI00374A742A
MSQNKFALWVADRFPSPADALAHYFDHAQAAASSVGALLEELPELDNGWHYLPNLEGQKLQDRSYKGEYVQDPDGTTWPSITFTGLGRASTFWKPRDLAFQDWQASRSGSKAIPDRTGEYLARAAELMAQGEANRAASEAQTQAGYLATANAVADAWHDAVPCAGHAYLTAKGVQANGLRQANADVRASLWNNEKGAWQNSLVVRKGDLLVPMVDAAGKLWNLQRIDAQGGKRFVMGGRKKGTFHRLDGTGRPWMAEGYATAATVRAALGTPVIVAFDAGNMKTVAEALPGIQAVAADNDAKKAGLKGAKATGLPFFMPPTVDDDWNDHAARYGIDDVAERLQLAASTARVAQAGANSAVTTRAAAGAKDSANANEGPARIVQPFEAVQAMAQLGIELATNMRQEPYANLANACAVLRGHPMFAGRIWYDTFHQEIMTTWDTERPRKWVDADRLQLTEIFQRDFGLVKFGDETIEKAAISVAQHDQRDELADWLRGLSWDGTPRLNSWLVHAVGASQDLYHDAVGANFLRSLVARGLMPGSKVDTMPVFEGPQGSNKSTMLSVLGGDYYAELTESLETKDFFVVIQGKWLVEIGELNAMRKADVTRIKQILSSSQDRCRLPYAKRAIDLPRRVVFAGTTNEHEYLRDSTGARRFWPISIERIDLAWLRQNREQLFAEAVNQVLEGATWWEVPTEEAKAQTEDRRETDVWEARIEEKFGHQSKVTTSEVLEGLGFEFSRMTQADQMRAAKALKAIGFVRKKMRFPGNPLAVWGFERKAVRQRPRTDAPF